MINQVMSFVAARRRGFVLDNKKRNQLAWDLLVALSAGVDELAMRSRKFDFKSLSPREELFRQYLQAVREGSDTEVNRRKRHDIICGLIEPIFERKDAKRGFSLEQRRILWNTADERVCKECGCQLSWADFQADHIKPFASGGKTDLANAAILCEEHNKKKGKKARAAAALRTARTLLLSLISSTGATAWSNLFVGSSAI